jgi:hypothetical protein
MMGPRRRRKEPRRRMKGPRRRLKEPRRRMTGLSKMMELTRTTELKTKMSSMTREPQKTRRGSTRLIRTGRLDPSLGLALRAALAVYGIGLAVYVAVPQAVAPQRLPTPVPETLRVDWIDEIPVADRCVQRAAGEPRELRCDS